MSYLWLCLCAMQFKTYCYLTRFLVICLRYFFIGVWKYRRKQQILYRSTMNHVRLYRDCVKLLGIGGTSRWKWHFCTFRGHPRRTFEINWILGWIFKLVNNFEFITLLCSRKRHDYTSLCLHSTQKKHIFISHRNCLCESNTHQSLGTKSKGLFVCVKYLLNNLRHSS